LSTAHLYLALGEGEPAVHWASVAHEGFDEAVTDDPELLADLLILRATLPPEGIEQMGRDAARAGELYPPDSPWRAMSYFYAGASRHLAGDLEEARRLLAEGARRGAATGPLVQVLCLTQLTLLHLDRDDLEGGLRAVSQAREQLERFQLDDYPLMAMMFVALALTRARVGRIEEAVADRKRAMEMLDELNSFPDWYLAQARIFLARACQLLDEAGVARALLAEASEFADRVPDAPTIRRWLAESESAPSAEPGGDARPDLTPAELRTLRFLPSHLSFREIADQSFVSPNTVKTQAQSVYRKLGASSRAEAVEQAREQGLLSDAPDG
jgi:LuxR family maltose regulon positive regulatory protein